MENKKGMLSISHDFKFFFPMAYLISLLTFVVHTYQPNITVVLKQFNQSNAITKCSSDLLVNNPFTIYGTVMTSKPLHDMSGQLFIFFNEKDNRKEETFYVNSFKECTGDKTCGWEELCCNISNNSIKIWITLPAPELYSEATLRLTVSYPGQRYNSSAIKLPKIIDPSKIEIAYNGRSLTQGITIKDGENVLRLCCLNAPKDCRPFVLHQPCPQSTYSTNCITCTVDTTQNGSFPLGFNVCGMDIYTPGNITTVATIASPGNTESNLYLLFLIIVPIIIPIIVICCLKQKKKCCFKKKTRSTELEENDGTNNELVSKKGKGKATKSNKAKLPNTTNRDN